MRRTATLLATAGLLLGAAASPAPAAPVWLAPTFISDPGGDAGSPLLALDGLGGAIAGWTRFDENGIVRLEVRVRPRGGPFGPVQRVSLPGSDASAPVLDIGSIDGRAVLVWTQAGQVWSAVRAPNGEFTEPVAFAQEAGETAGPADAMMSRDGEVVAVWTSSTPTEQRVRWAVRSPDGSIVTKPPLEASATAAFSHAGISGDGMGGVLAVWHRAEGGDTRIRAADRAPGGEPVLLGDIATATGAESVATPYVDLSQLGDATISWAWRGPGPPSDGEVRSRLRPQGGSFGDVIRLGAPGLAELQQGAGTQGQVMLAWTEAGVVRASPARGLPETLSPVGVQASHPSVGGGAALQSLVAWRRTDTGALQAAYQPMFGSFGAPADISAAGTAAAPAALAVDGAGGAVAAWSRTDGADTRIELARMDGAAPELLDLRVPATATAGTPAAFSVRAMDDWSATTVTWDFGDGTSAAGSEVSHAYQQAGAHTVVATGVDSAGHAASVSGSVQVAAAPVAPLAVTRFRMSRRVFRVGRKRTPLTARRTPVGSAFTFRLSTRARATITIERLVRTRRGRRYRRVRSALRRNARAGVNTVRFSGRLGRTALRPGSYRARLVATVAGQRARSRPVTFRIVR